MSDDAPITRELSEATIRAEATALAEVFRQLRLPVSAEVALAIVCLGVSVLHEVSAGDEGREANREALRRLVESVWEKPLGLLEQRAQTPRVVVEGNRTEH